MVPRTSNTETAWSILGSNLQNLEPGLSSGSLVLLTKETTILKVYKRVHPCITATESWADTASQRFKASERLLGHLVVAIDPRPEVLCF